MCGWVLNRPAVSSFPNIPCLNFLRETWICRWELFLLQMWTFYECFPSVGFATERKKAMEVQTMGSTQMTNVHPNKPVVGSKYLKVKRHGIHLACRASCSVATSSIVEYQWYSSRILKVKDTGVDAAIRHLRRSSNCTSLTWEKMKVRSLTSGFFWMWSSFKQLWFQNILSYTIIKLWCNTVCAWSVVSTLTTHPQIIHSY